MPEPMRLQSSAASCPGSAMSTILTLHDPQIARAYYAQGWWREDTLYTLLARHAQERPDAYALRDSRKRLTWAGLLRWVDVLAAQMQSIGLKRGQRVSVWLPNRVEAVVVFLACSRSGYVCNPSLHQNYTVEEIVRLLEARSALVECFGDDAGACTCTLLPGCRLKRKLRAAQDAFFAELDGSTLAEIAYPPRRRTRPTQAAA